ncbi:bifunctional SulP family inorganic anion transporter/carbonic anhydrase [Aeoliella mucimassa]|uniref:Carbonic anhydrase n=1 Tax=Aeoliella mucimassa TaxID=2527972 RepID=A0A518AW86_9BACT|nr:SulP family inorganic anion transporter [Aeoliella mucimassa]QDU58982.1 Carbonic anhydrase [Aeoliella mucimassa]
MPSTATTYSHPLYSISDPKTLPADLSSGLVVFLVALPLCLGIALASDAPPFAGLLAGTLGGLVVGGLSGSHTSVSGPAAGLTTIVAASIASLGSYQAFLMAVVIAGVLQVGLGVLKAGALSAFFPSSVIKGLLAAIGVILILKQIPHLLGRDSDPEGDMGYVQPDEHNTFSEIYTMIVEGDLHLGATVIGLASIALLVAWPKIKGIRSLPIPPQLIVVLAGVGLQRWFARLGDTWAISKDHLVSKIPVAESASDFFGYLTLPDLGALADPAVYTAGATIAIVASLETLLNLEAVDKIDPDRRHSPPSRELWAQGAGNIVSGLIGGLPITSVIVRGSVNANNGCKTKRSTLFHGLLLLVCVAFLPTYLNMIPLSALAAILLVTGIKLASPKLFGDMWSEGRYQFVPFIVTLVAIVFSDLLIGILIGLGISVLFILNSNVRRPIKRIVETHVDGEVLHIELANQVSFLNKAALNKLFEEVAPGSDLLIDARGTDYIDPDVLSLIREFKDQIAPAHNVRVSLRGFRTKYQLEDHIQYADFSTRDLLDRITPQQAIDLLLEGNRRFLRGEQISRDYTRQIDGTSREQSPLAVVLGCIDSRVPAEIIFDLGIGDILCVRVAGNVIGTKSLGSIEYGVAVAQVKLVVVLGHTRCGAVKSSLELLVENHDAHEATGCEHLGAVVTEVQQSVNEGEVGLYREGTDESRHYLADEIAARNVMRTVHEIIDRSRVIREAVAEDRVQVVGLLYDIVTGEVRPLNEQGQVKIAHHP